MEDFQRADVYRAHARWLLEQEAQTKKANALQTFKNVLTLLGITIETIVIFVISRKLLG